MRKWIIRILGVLIFFLLLAFSIIAFWSQQKTELFRDQYGQVLNNSIATIEDIDINGVSQRLVIRGKDKSNPILLHLHGGPGGPDRPMIRAVGADIEDLFTVIYWDERGTGGSYDSDIAPETMTLSQMSDDGIAITEYLINRFKTEKIYLQGHSWGTTVGTTMASKRPELFYAYIGIGQMANSRQSEILSYDYVYDAATEAGNQEHIDQLKSIGKPPYSLDQWSKKVMVQRQILWNYENPYRTNKETMFQIYMLYIQNPEYSISDKLGVLFGSEFSMLHLWDDAMEVNFMRDIPKLDLPVYMMQGKYDKHTATAVAKMYFDSLRAPEKQYFEFEKSAHAPHFEEYDRYREIMEKQVLSKD